MSLADINLAGKDYFTQEEAAHMSDEPVLKADDDYLLSAEVLASIRNDYVIRRGIYFLWANGEIVYVGQSTNIWQRVASHFVDCFMGRKSWKIDGYSFIEVHPDIDLDTVEQSYIRKFLPRHNRWIA